MARSVSCRVVLTHARHAMQSMRPHVRRPAQWRLHVGTNGMGGGGGGNEILLIARRALRVLSAISTIDATRARTVAASMGTPLGASATMGDGIRLKCAATRLL